MKQQGIPNSDSRRQEPPPPTGRPTTVSAIFPYLSTFQPCLPDQQPDIMVQFSLVTKQAPLTVDGISHFPVVFPRFSPLIINFRHFCIQNINFYNDNGSATLNSAGLTVPFVLSSVSGAILSSIETSG